MWFRALWVRVPSPTPDKSKGSGQSRSLISFTLGRRQVVRQGTLTPSPAGSNPAVPASFFRRGVQIEYDPIAQSAEQLPFKQWVRGSNPRRVTKKADTPSGICLFAARGIRTFQMRQSGGLPPDAGSTASAPYAVPKGYSGNESPRVTPKATPCYQNVTNRKKISKRNATN